jgi:hypothetical protein
MAALRICAFVALVFCAQQGAALVRPAASGALRSRVAQRTASPVMRTITPATADLNDIELAGQITAMDTIAKELRNGSAQAAFDNAQLLGWCAQAETINGRFAMFFFVTGLFTESITGQSVPQQINTMLQVVGFINPGA